MCFILMTILETFIRLRDDLKTWVTNNLNQKANISYVDEKFDAIQEFDPTEIQNAINANTTAIDTKVDKVEGKGLSTNDYTTTEKTKLAGIASGAQVNQNAFSNVTVGSTTIAADSTTDTLTVAAGTGVLTYNASPGAADMVWQVVKVYTLADGQKAVKVQRIK